MFVGIGLNLVRGVGGKGLPSTTWFLADGTFNLSGSWWDIVPFPIQWFLASGTFNLLGIWDDSRSYS